MINTTLCYIEKAGSYLLLHRTKKTNDVNKDKWIGIGGKFEEGESPFDCVCREVREETGFILNNAEYRGLVTFVSRTSDGSAPYYELMHVFWSSDFTEPPLPVACDEGELEWVPKSKMNELPHWESDELFMELIEKRSPFFSIKVEYLDGKMIKASREQ
ncbi:MAG: 8-oxo-dGTP diphosphatase [Spirochaetaceae bacterium]|nr:8-oxo-dGTP diphosphatase [Spirochaetaceae bacterium]